MRAILYLRLSNNTEDSTSIVRQQNDLQALAANEGWEVAATFTDDGISGRKSRANAAEALRMIRDNEADVLAVWKLDRWTRQGLSAIGDLVAALNSRPGALFVALQDGLRSDQAAFGIIAAVLSETAKAEADNAATRIRSSIAHRSKTGRFPGGPIPFGFRSVPATEGAPGKVLVHDPTEVALVRDAARRLAEGEPLHSVVKSFRAGNVPTPKSAFRLALLQGKPTDGLDRGYWHTTTLIQVLAGQSMVGRIVYKGQPVTDEDGLPRTFWEPVLDLATWETVRSLYFVPGAPKSTHTIRARSRLLSGMVHCGTCDAPMTLHSRRRRGQDHMTRLYICPASSRDCERKVSIDAEAVEKYVSEAYLASFGHLPELREEVAADTTERDQLLREIDAAINEATSELRQDGVDMLAIVSRLERLKARKAEVLAQPVTRESRWVETGLTYAEAFAASDVARQRRFLDQAIDHISVRSSVGLRGGHRTVRTDRVEIHWLPSDSQNY